MVQSVELQGNRCGTGKSRQNTRGTGIAKFASATPHMTVQLTNNTGKAPVKGVSPAKVMSPWSGDTGIAKLAARFMSVQLTAVQGAATSKLVPPAKWCLCGDIPIAGATPPVTRVFILLNKPSCEGLLLLVAQCLAYLCI